MKSFRTILVATTTTLSLTGGVLAAEKMSGMPGMDASKSSAPASSAQATHAAVGVIKQVDAARGKVTISHDPIKSLEWPAMTMSFSVKDKALFDKLTVGKKVEFQLAKQGDDYVVTSVK